MSKKEFKRTIGGLYKKGFIEIQDEGIRLRDQSVPPRRKVMQTSR